MAKFKDLGACIADELMKTPDIVERLREHKNCAEGDCENGALITEAADEIAFLRREVARLRLRVNIEDARLYLNASVECPHCHWGFHPSVIDQHIREKH